MPKWMDGCRVLLQQWTNIWPPRWLLSTGPLPSQERGTESQFGIPDVKTRSPNAKAVWKVAHHKLSSPKTGALILTITPPAEAPIGRYRLSVKHRNEETVLAELSMLFNPWCSGRLSINLLKYYATSKNPALKSILYMLMTAFSLLLCTNFFNSCSKRMIKKISSKSSHQSKYVASPVSFPCCLTL